MKLHNGKNLWNYQAFLDVQKFDTEPTAAITWIYLHKESTILELSLYIYVTLRTCFLDDYSALSLNTTLAQLRNFLECEVSQDSF